VTLIRSVSGVRGTTGVEITEEMVGRYARAFASMVGGRMAVGFDGRSGGEGLKSSVVEGLRSGGASVLDLGVVPTPTVGIVVKWRGLDGGVVVTASHNPETQNGLKFFSSRGVFLVSEQAERLFSLADGPEPAASETTGCVSDLHGAVEHHHGLILDSGIVDESALRSAAPSVVVDCVNGAGSVALPSFLERVGCRVRAQNAEPGAGFTRGPEPVPENLGELGEAVVREGANLGLACDPDADRLAVVDENGRPIGEEYTLALAARAVLARRPGPVVANMSTSRMMDDVAAEFGVPIFRSPVGEINVVTKMDEVSAVVGGEGNGGVILPAVHRGRDACTAAALVLSAVLDSRRTVSQLVGGLPSYSILKKKLPLEGVTRDELAEAVAGAFPGSAVDLTDGAKMTWPDRWVHARMSGTEPVVRVIAEAPDGGSASSLVARATEALSKLTKDGR